MNAYSEGNDFFAHLMKEIGCGHNWPTTSIIHSPLGGKIMGCQDWSKLITPLEWAPFLSLQFSLVLIDIFVLYSMLLLLLLSEHALFLLAAWPFLHIKVAKQTTPSPIVIPTLPIIVMGHRLMAMATKWSSLLFRAQEFCPWAQGPLHELSPLSLLLWV